MLENPEHNLVAIVRKCAGHVVRGIVTPQEFINKMFDEFANTERVYPELVPELWLAIPELTREDFARAVRAAARPDYRYRSFYIAGERPMTGAEPRQDADLRTARVQAWAREFIRFLDAGKA